MRQPRNWMKCMIVGDCTSGKASISVRYWTKTFQHHEHYEYVPFSDGYCGSGTWQTQHGGEDMPRLRPLSYPQTDVFIICFSVTRPSTFHSVRTSWYPEVEHHMPGVPKLLVGTMTDLREDAATIANLAEERMRPISYEEGIEMANILGIEKYMECSARTGEGVDKVFEDAIRLAAGHQLKASRNERNCLVM
ncbi:putative small GTPase [Flagelloscypha sp. PMI_526]|nr:putative small GTPase [Flagelloscypha sp. PMI_526]